MGLPPCLIYFFDYPIFGGRCATRGSTMVPLGRELVSSHRLSIQTMPLVSGTVPFGRNLWCKFWLGVANPQFGGMDGRMGSEMGPLSRPGTTSYRLPIVTITIVLSLTVFEVPDRRTGGRNWSSKRRHTLKCTARPSIIHSHSQMNSRKNLPCASPRICCRNTLLRKAHV